MCMALIVSHFVCVWVRMCIPRTCRATFQNLSNKWSNTSPRVRDRTLGLFNSSKCWMTFAAALFVYFWQNLSAIIALILKIISLKFAFELNSPPSERDRDISYISVHCRSNCIDRVTGIVVAAVITACMAFLPTIFTFATMAPTPAMP